MRYQQPEYGNILQEIIIDIEKTIDDMQEIYKHIIKEDSIDSYESLYCQRCDESCGRSNSEILNCMIHRIETTKLIQNQYDEMEYTKEHLEKDFESIIKNLRRQRSELRDFLSHIQTGQKNEI